MQSDVKYRILSLEWYKSWGNEVACASHSAKLGNPGVGTRTREHVNPRKAVFCSPGFPAKPPIPTAAEPGPSQAFRSIYWMQWSVDSSVINIFVRFLIFLVFLGRLLVKDEEHFYCCSRILWNYQRLYWFLSARFLILNIRILSRLPVWHTMVSCSMLHFFTNDVDFVVVCDHLYSSFVNNIVVSFACFNFRTYIFF